MKPAVETESHLSRRGWQLPASLSTQGIFQAVLFIIYYLSSSCHVGINALTVQTPNKDMVLPSVSEQSG